MLEHQFELRTDVRKFRGRGNRGRGNYMSRGDRGGMKGPMPFVQEKFRDQHMNGALPPRRGMGRMHPYQDPRGRGAIRGGHPGFMPPPPPLQFEREMREPFPPPALRRGHPPPPPPPPPGLIGFRGMPPPPRGRGILLPPPPSPQRGRFPHPRGFPNGRGTAAHPPPPGRGQRWPAPPGGRRF